MPRRPYAGPGQDDRLPSYGENMEENPEVNISQSDWSFNPHEQGVRAGRQPPRQIGYSLPSVHQAPAPIIQPPPPAYQPPPQPPSYYQSQTQAFDESTRAYNQQMAAHRARMAEMQADIDRRNADIGRMREQSGAWFENERRRGEQPERRARGGSIGHGGHVNKAKPRSEKKETQKSKYEAPMNGMNPIKQPTW